MEISDADRRRDGLEKPLLLFFLFAAAGWLWEVLFVAVSAGELVNRGFLHGPWLPVYGAGGMLFLLLPDRLRERDGALFLLCALLGGALEYGTSLWMEAVFHARWWDYAGWAGNLGGRVCLASAAAFGLTGWWLVRRAEPALWRALDRMPAGVRRRLCRWLCALFAADTAVSLLLPNRGAGVSFPA